MATKYIARLDGKIVGKRTTKDRTYTHAVVTQLSIEHAREMAYGYNPTDTDRSNFDYYTEIANCVGVFFGPVDKWSKGPVVGQLKSSHKNYGRTFTNTYDYNADDVADAKAHIEGGFAGYAVRLRLKEIERFEELVKRGHFEPGTETWCGRPDLAQKEAAKRQGEKRYALVQIVPAEKA